jgi:hypothetical protein
LFSLFFSDALAFYDDELYTIIFLKLNDLTKVVVLDIGSFPVFVGGQTQGLPLHSFSVVGVFAVIEKYQNW